jgi:hypothetical protein
VAHPQIKESLQQIMVVRYYDISLLLHKEGVTDNAHHSKADILFDEEDTLLMKVLAADECHLEDKEQDDAI